MVQVSRAGKLLLADMAAVTGLNTLRIPCPPLPALLLPGLVGHPSLELPGHNVSSSADRPLGGHWSSPLTGGEDDFTSTPHHLPRGRPAFHGAPLEFDPDSPLSQPFGLLPLPHVPSGLVTLFLLTSPMNPRS